MFKKLKGGLGLKGADTGVKYKIDVQSVAVDGLPDGVKKCRVVMSRGAKVVMTDVKDARNGGCGMCSTPRTCSTPMRLANHEHTFLRQAWPPSSRSFLKSAPSKRKGKTLGTR